MSGVSRNPGSEDSEMYSIISRSSRGCSSGVMESEDWEEINGDVLNKIRQEAVTAGLTEEMRQVCRSWRQNLDDRATSLTIQINGIEWFTRLRLKRFPNLTKFVIRGDSTGDDAFVPKHIPLWAVHYLSQLRNMKHLGFKDGIYMASPLGAVICGVISSGVKLASLQVGSLSFHLDYAGGPSWLTSLTGLSSLELTSIIRHNCAFLEGVTALTQLRDLDLSSAQPPMVAVPHIQGLTNLTRLQLFADILVQEDRIRWPEVFSAARHLPLLQNLGLSIFSEDIPEEVCEDVREVAPRLRVLSILAQPLHLPALLQQFPFTRLQLLYLAGCHRCTHEPWHAYSTAPHLPSLLHFIKLDVWPPARRGARATGMDWICRWLCQPGIATSKGLGPLNRPFPGSYWEPLRPAWLRAHAADHPIRDLAPGDGLLFTLPRPRA